MSIYRVGVVSDTHCPERVPYSVLNELTTVLRDCDMILHTGDIETQTVLDTLSSIAPVYAVKGDDEIDTHDLPEKRIVEIGGLRIGMHHSHRPFLTELPSRLQSALGLYNGPTWAGIHDWLLNKFKDDDVQVIVFGHFHRPYSDYHDGILLLNPGSIYQLSADSLAYRMRKSRSRLRRFTARLELRALSPDRTIYPPTVAIMTINSRQITTEIKTLSPINYAE